jgi:hypothetical protein
MEDAFLIHKKKPFEKQSFAQKFVYASSVYQVKENR